MIDDAAVAQALRRSRRSCAVQASRRRKCRREAIIYYSIIILIEFLESRVSTLFLHTP